MLRVTANIWDTINETFHILRSEDFINKVTRINLSSRNADEIIICCYQNEQPVCLVDIRGCINKILHLLVFTAFHRISSSIARITVTSSQNMPIDDGTL
jgi:hypothetical protein